MSALVRPQFRYYDGLMQQAAALMGSLAVNYPLVDGNKRVAIAATDVFLRSNGVFINCENDSAFAHFEELFNANSFKFEQIRVWLFAHVEPLPGPS